EAPSRTGATAPADGPDEDAQRFARTPESSADAVGTSGVAHEQPQGQAPAPPSPRWDRNRVAPTLSPERTPRPGEAPTVRRPRPTGKALPVGSVSLCVVQ